MDRSVDRTPNQHGDVMTNPEEPKNIVRLSALLLLSFALASAYGASPVGKTWTKSESTLDCGNGRRGTKCFELATINLTWDHPTQREDDSPMSLSEVSHYIIQMQRDGGAVKTLAVAKSTSFTLRHMPAGVYTFAIATVDSDRLRGNFSTTIQVTVN